MTEETLAGFDWDAGNRVKCRKHGVSLAEIEDIFRRAPSIRPDTTHSDREIRHLAIGRTATGRHVFVVFAIRERDGKRLIRPISARYMHRQEIGRYEKENPQL